MPGPLWKLVSAIGSGKFNSYIDSLMVFPPWYGVSTFCPSCRTFSAYAHPAASYPHAFTMIVVWAVGLDSIILTPLTDLVLGRKMSISGLCLCSCSCPSESVRFSCKCSRFALPDFIESECYRLNKKHWGV